MVRTSAARGFGMADLAVRGGQVFLPGTGVTEADVLVEGGRIAGVVAPGAGTAAAELDARGLAVLPGAVDAHIHLGHGSDIACPRVPGDAASETGAAARGGVTTVLSYVMSAEPHLPAFDALIAVTEAGARIDVGYHFVIATEDHLAEVPGLVARGAPTAKLFMNIRGNEGARLGLPGVDDGYLFRLLEALRAQGGMLCPHPETIEVAWVLRDRVMAADPDGTGGLATWNATRPPFVEAEALSRATYFARVVGAPVHAVHTSSQEALEAAVRQRAAGSDVSIETCLHYLTHDTESDLGATGKVNPPLRPRQDRDALWAALARGDIDTVGTDHIHRPMRSKEGGIWGAQPGFPGLDTFYPAYLTEGYHRRGVALERLVPLVSGGPARRMGLAQKGRIAPGADADLAMVDLAADWIVGKGDLASDAGYSIYEGQRMRARVVHTLSRGRFVMREGALQDDAIGGGRYVPRRLSRVPSCGQP
ncbi:MAG: dihydroorotase family protein [Pseudomonadota bacterium]